TRYCWVKASCRQVLPSAISRGCKPTLQDTIASLEMCPTFRLHSAHNSPGTACQQYCSRLTVRIQSAWLPSCACGQDKCRSRNLECRSQKSEGRSYKSEYRILRRA